jgi:uncharacterized membrane protein (UPF0127 family)
MYNKFTSIALLFFGVMLYLDINITFAVNNIINKSYNSQDLHLTTIEIVDDNKKRMQGLMYRKNLCTECAMLFVFNYPTTGGFWMKNTEISLDIIFMNNQGVIINYHTNTEPFNTNKIYSPKGSYYYVLETKAGFVDKHHLQEGMQIDLKDLMVRGGMSSK